MAVIQKGEQKEEQRYRVEILSDKDAVAKLRGFGVQLQGKSATTKTLGVLEDWSNRHMDSHPVFEYDPSLREFFGFNFCVKHGDKVYFFQRIPDTTPDDASDNKFRVWTISHKEFKAEGLRGLAKHLHRTSTLEGRAKERAERADKAVKAIKDRKRKKQLDAELRTRVGVNSAGLTDAICLAHADKVMEAVRAVTGEAESAAEAPITAEEQRYARGFYKYFRKEGPLGRLYGKSTTLVRNKPLVTLVKLPTEKKDPVSSDVSRLEVRLAGPQEIFGMEEGRGEDARREEKTEEHQVLVTLLTNGLRNAKGASPEEVAAKIVHVIGWENAVRMYFEEHESVQINEDLRDKSVRYLWDLYFNATHGEGRRKDASPIWGGFQNLICIDSEEEDRAEVLMDALRRKYRPDEEKLASAASGKGGKGALDEARERFRADTLRMEKVLAEAHFMCGWEADDTAEFVHDNLGMAVMDRTFSGLLEHTTQIDRDVDFLTSKLIGGAVYYYATDPIFKMCWDHYYGSQTHGINVERFDELYSHAGSAEDYVPVLLDAVAMFGSPDAFEAIEEDWSRWLDAELGWGQRTKDVLHFFFPVDSIGKAIFPSGNPEYLTARGEPNPSNILAAVRADQGRTIEAVAVVLVTLKLKGVFTRTLQVAFSKEGLKRALIQAVREGAEDAKRLIRDSGKLDGEDLRRAIDDVDGVAADMIAQITTGKLVKSKPRVMWDQFIKDAFGRRTTAKGFNHLLAESAVPELRSMGAQARRRARRVFDALDDELAVNRTAVAAERSATESAKRTQAMQDLQDRIDDVAVRLGKAQQEFDAISEIRPATHKDVIKAKGKVDALDDVHKRLNGELTELNLQEGLTLRARVRSGFVSTAEVLGHLRDKVVANARNKSRARRYFDDRAKAIDDLKLRRDKARARRDKAREDLEPFREIQGEMERLRSHPDYNDPLKGRLLRIRYSDAEDRLRKAGGRSEIGRLEREAAEASYATMEAEAAIVSTTEELLIWGGQKTAIPASYVRAVLYNTVPGLETLIEWVKRTKGVEAAKKITWFFVALALDPRYLAVRGVVIEIEEEVNLDAERVMRQAYAAELERGLEVQVPVRVPGDKKRAQTRRSFTLERRLAHTGALIREAALEGKDVDKAREHFNHAMYLFRRGHEEGAKHAAGEPHEDDYKKYFGFAEDLREKAEEALSVARTMTPKERDSRKKHSSLVRARKRARAALRKAEALSETVRGELLSKHVDLLRELNELRDSLREARRIFDTTGPRTTNQLIASAHEAHRIAVRTEIALSKIRRIEEEWAQVTYEQAQPVLDKMVETIETRLRGRRPRYKRAIAAVKAGEYGKAKYIAERLIAAVEAEALESEVEESEVVEAPVDKKAATPRRVVRPVSTKARDAAIAKHFENATLQAWARKNLKSRLTAIQVRRFKSSASVMLMSGKRSERNLNTVLRYVAGEKMSPGQIAGAKRLLAKKYRRSSPVQIRKKLGLGKYLR